MFFLRFFVIAILLFFAGCKGPGGNASSEQKEASTVENALLVFDKLQHDFGHISQGDEVACRFGFVNEGIAPLIIQEVKAGCGCTNIKYPEKPVLPGERGAVEVTFNSRGRQGIQRQSVRVFSNGSEQTIQLVITANVQ